MSDEKEVLSVRLPKELTERMRNAVYWTPGSTMGDMAQNAIDLYLIQLEKRTGEPFPLRESKLKVGRKV
jgi:hypothetical protein